MADRRTWRLGHRPALDGIRAVAAGVVVLDHVDVPGFEAGGLGVDVFFALSGFLITSLLVEELADTGAVRLGRFWLRRALRLVPALVAVVATVAAMLPLMPSSTADGIVPTLLYLTNWQRAFFGDVGALGHTWSLAVEEQFYLVWPPVLIGLARLGGVRLALRCAVLGMVLAVVVREVAAQAELVSAEHVYNAFYFRADGLLAGCALALAFHAGFDPHRLGGRRTTHVILVVMATAFLACNWVSPPASIRFLAAATTCVLIAALVAGSVPVVYRALEHPVMRWVGLRSYGLYLWHFPVRKLYPPEVEVSDQLAIVVITIVVTAASYRYVELPFLRLKGRRGPQRDDQDRVADRNVRSATGRGLRRESGHGRS